MSRDNLERLPSLASLGREIFDGGSPFAPRGAIAQAWSVAQELRVWRSKAPR
jgi:glycogen debranching enzyme